MPLFSDKLWKLVDAQGDGKTPGDRKSGRDYRQREFWVATDGTVSFSGDSPGEIVRIFGGKSAQEMVLRALGPGETCFDHAYTLGPSGHPDPVVIASEVAGISGALGRFRKTIEALQSGPDAVAALRRSSAEELGLASSSGGPRPSPVGAGPGAQSAQVGALAGAFLGGGPPKPTPGATPKLSAGFGMGMATKLLKKKKAAFSKTRQEADRRLEKAKAFVAAMPETPAADEWKPPPVDLRSIVMQPLPVPPRHRGRLASPPEYSRSAGGEASSAFPALAPLVTSPDFMSVWGGITDSKGAPLKTRASTAAAAPAGAAPPKDIKSQTFSGGFATSWVSPRGPRPQISSGRAAVPQQDSLTGGFSLWGGSSVFSDGNDVALLGSTWGGGGGELETTWGKSSKPPRSGVPGSGLDGDGGFAVASTSLGNFPSLKGEHRVFEANAAVDPVEARTRVSAVHRRATLVDRAVRLGVLDDGQRRNPPSFRAGLVEKGPAKEVVAPLEASSTSGVTQEQQQNQRWRSWADWCRKHNVDPHQPKLRELADAGAAGRAYAAKRRPWQAA